MNIIYAKMNTISDAANPLHTIHTNVAMLSALYTFIVLFAVCSE